jgi:hypothetical protein
MCWVRCTRSPQGALFQSAYCSAENNPMAAGMMTVIKRSSPTNYSHFSKDTRRCIGLMASEGDGHAR